MAEERSATQETGAALLRPFGGMEIINLAERADRRAEMTAELARVGLAPGRDGVRFHAAVRGVAANGFASAGAHGCFLSHLAILEAALHSGRRAVLIAEDDMRLVLPPPRDLAATLAPLEGDGWDFFWGGYHHPERFLGEGRGLIDLGTRFSIGGTHLYGVHRRVLPALIAAMHQLLEDNRAGVGRAQHVDLLYHHFRSGRTGTVTLVLSPALAVQRPSRSDVQPLRLVDRLPVLRSLAALARRVR